MSKKKKIFVLVAMVLLLVVTGYLNIALSKNNSTIASNASANASFLTAYRNNKEATRKTMLEYYNSILSSDASQEKKDQVTDEKVTLAKRMEQETILESLIMSIGYEDAVVTITDDNTTCVVKSNGLTGDQVDKILALVVNQGKFIPSTIRVLGV